MEMAGKLVEKCGIIGNELQPRTAKAAKKWTEILERISATVQTLAQQNFFFEVIVNYCLAYQSRKSYSMFDSLMREHWEPVFGKVWLLSHSTSDIKNEITQNELVYLKQEWARPVLFLQSKRPSTTAS